MFNPYYLSSFRSEGCIYNKISDKIIEPCQTMSYFEVDADRNRLLGDHEVASKIIMRVNLKTRNNEIDNPKIIRR